MKISKSSTNVDPVLKFLPPPKRGTFYSWIYDRENIRRWVELSSAFRREIVSKKRLRKLKRNNNLGNKNETISNTCMYIYITRYLRQYLRTKVASLDGLTTPSVLSFPPPPLDFPRSSRMQKSSPFTSRRVSSRLGKKSVVERECFGRADQYHTLLFFPPLLLLVSHPPFRRITRRTISSPNFARKSKFSRAVLFDRNRFLEKFLSEDPSVDPASKDARRIRFDGPRKLPRSFFFFDRGFSVSSEEGWIGWRGWKVLRLRFRVNNFILEEWRTRGGRMRGICNSSGKRSLRDPYFCHCSINNPFYTWWCERGRFYILFEFAFYKLEIGI